MPYGRCQSGREGAYVRGVWGVSRGSGVARVEGVGVDDYQVHQDLDQESDQDDDDPDKEQNDYQQQHPDHDGYHRQ